MAPDRHGPVIGHLDPVGDVGASGEHAHTA
jgi:hypothetical protein